MDRARAAISAHAALNAFISVDTESQHDGPILAVKDLVDVVGMVTTNGTLQPRPRVAQTDASIVAAFRTAGWGVVGKTNLHELALGPTSGNPHFGAVGNPVDFTRIAGGSSGGSAAAVGMGMCDIAIGTDTGGSIRIPASLCGVAGWRPTGGTVGLDGVWPLSPTLDTVGPMARDVRTIAEAMVDIGLLGTEATHDAGAFSLAAPHSWIAGVDMEAEVERSWNRVGSSLPVIELPPMDRFIDVGLTVLYAEAATSNEDQLLNRAGTIGKDVRELLQRGRTTLAVDYLGAMRERLRLQEILERQLETVDAILLPATATTAPLLGSDPILFRDALTVFTRPFGVTGHPVVVLPAPTSGLPVGMQLVGRQGSDARLLAIARSLEQSWAAAQPNARV
ncbi:amidase [Luethyella okanaganae]|uniref:Amidase n=1 Tax=Luethyella okanaganae TaxID=69372 RepID=A0ABW1VHU2_9MICO